MRRSSSVFESWVAAACCLLFAFVDVAECHRDDAVAIRSLPPSDQYYVGYRPQRNSLGTMCPPGMIPVKCDTGWELNGTCMMIGTSDGVVATATFAYDDKTGKPMSVIDWSSNVPVAVVIVKGGVFDNVYAYWPEATEKPDDAPPLTCRQNKAISHVGMCLIPHVGIDIDANATDVRVHDWNVTKEIYPTRVSFFTDRDGDGPYSFDAAVTYVWWSTYRSGSREFRVAGSVSLYDPWTIEVAISRVVVELWIPSRNVTQTWVLLDEVDPDVIVGPNQTHFGLPHFSFALSLDDDEADLAIPNVTVTATAFASNACPPFDAIDESYPPEEGVEAYLEWLEELFVTEGYEPDSTPMAPCGWTAVSETSSTVGSDEPCVVVTDQPISCDVPGPHYLPVGLETLVVDAVMCPPSDGTYSTIVPTTFSLIVGNSSFCDLARVRGVPSEVANEGDLLPPWEIPNTFVVDDDPARVDVEVFTVRHPCTFDASEWIAMLDDENVTEETLERVGMLDDEGTYVAQLIVGAIQSDPEDVRVNGVVPFGWFAFSENVAPPGGVPPPLHTLIANSSSEVRALLAEEWEGAESCVGLSKIRSRLISELAAAELNVAATGFPCAEVVRSDVCDAINDGHFVVAELGCEDWWGSSSPDDDEGTPLVVRANVRTDDEGEEEAWLAECDSNARAIVAVLELWNAGCIPPNDPC